MGLSEDVTAALAGTALGRPGAGADRSAGCRKPGSIRERSALSQVIALAEELIGFPRHLSQHVGGFVLTRRRLDETVPIGNAAMADRTVIEWDKDDIDALGILKVDVLGARHADLHPQMLRADRRLAWGGLHAGDACRARSPKSTRCCAAANSIGVFQVESRAQMNMLPRLRPQDVLRSGDRGGDRPPRPDPGRHGPSLSAAPQGLEREEYPAPDPAFGDADELYAVLGKTKGVPLFQEQAMKLAIVAADFTPGEPNELRRAMATFKRRGTIGRLEQKMIAPHGRARL